MANDVLEAVSSASAAVISPQVLAEFFDVVTRPRGTRQPILSVHDAFTAVERMLLGFNCVSLTDATLIAAARAARDYGIRIYDATIWATARLHRIPIVLTEDKPARPEIEGVRYTNPFAPSFQLGHIGL